MSATRFRLRRSRWRGLRFAFEATTTRAYGAILVVVLLWVSSTVIVAFATPERTMLLAATGLPLVLWPWMHHRLKAFQHGRVRYGEHVSAFRPAVRRFYVTYLVSFLPAMLAGFTAALLAPDAGTGWIVAALGVGCLYLGVWPYIAARLQAIVWGQTTLGPVRFETVITARRTWRLAATNLLGLVVTAGLYWPFASVAWARYRIECMSVLSEVPLDTLDAQAAPAAIAVAGEGALDLFGIDLGW